MMNDHSKKKQNKKPKTKTTHKHHTPQLSLTLIIGYGKDQSSGSIYELC